jgi:hypothetical protein
MKTFKQFILEVSSSSFGGVKKEDLYSTILSYLKDKPTYNMGKPPTNGETYGIDGTAESWARFYTELAGHESGYNAAKPFKNDINGVPEPGGSGGLFQLGRDQIEIWAKKYPSLAKQYGLDPDRNYSEQELYNSDLNTRGMLFIGDALLRENYAVGPKQGLGRTIGQLSWKKIANKTPTSSDYSSSPDVQNMPPGSTDPKKDTPKDDFDSPADAAQGLLQGLQAMAKVMGGGIK